MFGLIVLTFYGTGCFTAIDLPFAEPSKLWRLNSIDKDSVMFYKEPLQPSQCVKIPKGATHWAVALINPFFIVETVYVGDYANKSLNEQVLSRSDICGIKERLTGREGLIEGCDGRWYFETRKQFVDGAWEDCVANRSRKNSDVYCFNHQVTELKDLIVPENARVVKTPDGDGFLLGYESTGRLVVELKNNPYDFRPAFYFKRDVFFL